MALRHTWQSTPTSLRRAGARLWWSVGHFYVTPHTTPMVRTFLHHIFLILAIASTSAAGQARSQPPTSPPAQTARSASELADLSIAKQQIKMLEAQLSSIREYHGSLLDTVYWALGGVFVIAGLLVGFGWFANFKVYERDKEALRDEMNSKAESAAKELTAQMTKEVTALQQSLKEQVAAGKATLEASLKALSTSAVQPLSESLSTLDRRVFEIDLRNQKAKMEANPSDNMALTDALNLLELCYRRSQDELPNIMHFMLKKIEKGGKLTANEITRVNAVLDKLPSHYKALADRVRAKLVASDIFG